MFILLTTILLLMIHSSECGMNATAVLHPDNSILLLGTLTFTQENADALVRITGTFCGLTADSAHGFHVHTDPISEYQPNCSDAGGHFNPYNTPHGPRTANITSRHVGDLGNITTNETGGLYIDIEDSIIQLYNNTQSILNRTVVIHLLRDDGGEGGFTDSNTTGNAGARIVCGLIRLSSDDPTPPTITTSSESTTSTSQSGSTTTTSASTMTITTPTMTATTATNTPHSAGINIQPMMLVLMTTMAIGHLIRC